MDNAVERSDQVFADCPAKITLKQAGPCLLRAKQDRRHPRVVGREREECRLFVIRLTG